MRYHQSKEYSRCPFTLCHNLKVHSSKICFHCCKLADVFRSSIGIFNVECHKKIYQSRRGWCQNKDCGIKVSILWPDHQTSLIYGQNLCQKVQKLDVSFFGMGWSHHQFGLLLVGKEEPGHGVSYSCRDQNVGVICLKLIIPFKSIGTKM